MIGGNTILLSLNQDFIIDSKPWVYTSMILSTKLLFTPENLPYLLPTTLLACHFPPHLTQHNHSETHTNNDFHSLT